MSANEATRRMTVIGWLDTILRDLKYTFRMLARTPGFTAVAVLTLALGIGANTAIFTLLDQVLLRLLPVKDPQQLVLLTMRGRHYGRSEEHTSELQSQFHLVCRLLLEKKK